MGTIFTEVFTHQTRRKHGDDINEGTGGRKIHGLISQRYVADYLTGYVLI